MEVITPDPRSSGGARWNFLAAWAYADKKFAGDEIKDKESLRSLHSNATALDSGVRGPTTTFAENGRGDTLLAQENETYLPLKEHPDTFEIATPFLSILAQLLTAVADVNVKKRGTEKVSKAYLECLHLGEAQHSEGQNYYRSFDPDILKDFSDTFDLNVALANIGDDFGDWDKAAEEFFADSTIFGQIYRK